MKRFLITALAATALSAAAMPAAAQVFQPINQRQATLDARIDQGVRSGALTRGEAIKLRSDFREIAAIEARYRASNGLSAAERVDLERRMDALSARIWISKNDRDAYYGRNWQSINQRQANLDSRIDQGVRSGALTRVEAARLRAEFQTIVVLEANYRRSGGGLTAWERNDLDQRMNALSARIRINKHDGQTRR